MAAGLEASPAPILRCCGRLPVSSYWRGFAQQAGGAEHEPEKEPGSSSKASTDDATKADNAEQDDAKASADESKESKSADAGEADSTKKASDEEAKAEAEAKEEELTPVERLQRDLDDFTERSRGKKKDLLLALADFENTKKKYTKEREGRRRIASTNFARRMVEVYKEFEEVSAFKISTEGKEEGSPIAALQEGVSLTRDLFGQALEKSNVERLPVELGTPVVNARHEVVGSASGDGPEGSIAEVSEDGWISDLRSSSPQVLQKAKVKTVGAAE